MHIDVSGRGSKNTRLLFCHLQYGDPSSCAMSEENLRINEPGFENEPECERLRE